MSDSREQEIGCVVIGRNEGERLIRCLDSLVGRAGNIVYVDSGSTDRSVAEAQARGVEVVNLDTSVPFTAARARNAGFARLLERAPDVEYVQFVDGDCEVVPGWLETAHRTLRERRELAVVCGRRRERYPEASIYNRAIDVEWDTPVGDADACGGDAMMRVEAFRAVGGFDPTLIAGEEPELCVRLRLANWKIARVDAEMTLHDAAIIEFGQWWKRMKRAGHAFAEGSAIHGMGPTRHWVRETGRSLFWGIAFPALAVGAAVPTLGASLGLLWIYPVQVVRAYRDTSRAGRSHVDAAAYALNVTLAKFPEAQGALQYYFQRAQGKRSGLFEYK